MNYITFHIWISPINAHGFHAGMCACALQLARKVTVADEWLRIMSEMPELPEVAVSVFSRFYTCYHVRYAGSIFVHLVLLCQGGRKHHRTRIKPAIGTRKSRSTYRPHGPIGHGVILPFVYLWSSCTSLDRNYLEPHRACFLLYPLVHMFDIPHPQQSGHVFGVRFCMRSSFPNLTSHLLFFFVFKCYV